MSELGSGSGSSYPGALDTNATLESASTAVRFAVPNDNSAAIISVQTELGINPAGILTDVKTFLQTEHNTNGTHGAITTTSVDGFKKKVVDIGDWNMDTGATTTVAHGLTLADIRLIQAFVRNDANTTYSCLEQGDSSSENPASAGSTNITLARTASGVYDNGNYDSTSYNRGWVFIWYSV